MPKYMLDTDICSYIIRENPPSVANKFRNIDTENLFISSVTYGELYFGAVKRNIQNITDRVILFTSLLKIIPWDGDAAKEYATIRNYLEKNGLVIGNMDMLIAASAKSMNAVLVSNNTKHFERIPGLALENWA